MILHLSGSKLFRVFLFFSCLIILVIVFPGEGNTGSISGPFHQAYTFDSGSHSYNFYTPLVNPVFPGVQDQDSVSYRFWAFDKSREFNHHVLITALGFAFSYIRFNTLYNEDSEEYVKEPTDFFSINKGFFLSNFFGLGAGYRWSNSKNESYDGYKSFQMGILFRPCRYISLGYVLNDINEPVMNKQKARRNELYSISLRPAGKFLTLSFDAYRRQDSSFNEEDMALSTTLNLIRGISLEGRWEIKNSFFLGLTVPFGLQSANFMTTKINSHRTFSGQKKAGYTSAGITFSDIKLFDSIRSNRAYLVIHIHGEIDEFNKDLPGRAKPAFYEILESLRTAGNDPFISGTFIIVDSSSLGFAQVSELIKEINIFKGKGKKVYSFLTSMGNKEYFLCSAADKIYLAPNMIFTLTGLKAEVYFYKNALDKAGIKFESIKAGDYKSFDEPFTRNKMSSEYRENLTALLADLNEQFLGQIGTGRNIDRKVIENLFQAGFLLPERAKKMGFIDEIEFPDSAIENIRESRKIFSTVDLQDYINMKQEIIRWGIPPVIAVMHVSGTLIKGETDNVNPIFPDSMGDLTFKKILEGIMADASVKAVVIRINSGGGSALASGFMWHHIKRLREKYNKPVVFSFGNMAASGGYYIACTGDKIFAEESTITGSIGVIMGKLSLKELYEKLGINREVIKFSEFADIFTESRNLTEKERSLLKKGIAFTYKEFLDKVKESRKIPEEKIHKVAGGRVYTGKQAKKANLIDSIGGLLAAIEFAKVKSGIKNECSIYHYPVSEPAFMKIISSMSRNKNPASELGELVNFLRKTHFNNEKVKYELPYRIVIK